MGVRGRDFDIPHPDLKRKDILLSDDKEEEVKTYHYQLECPHCNKEFILELDETQPQLDLNEEEMKVKSRYYN